MNDDIERKQALMYLDSPEYLLAPRGAVYVQPMILIKDDLFLGDEGDDCNCGLSESSQVIGGNEFQVPPEYCCCGTVTEEELDAWVTSQVEPSTATWHPWRL